MTTARLLQGPPTAFGLSGDGNVCLWGPSLPFSKSTVLKVRFPKPATASWQHVSNVSARTTPLLMTPKLWGRTSWRFCCKPQSEKSDLQSTLRTLSL